MAGCRRVGAGGRVTIEVSERTAQMALVALKLWLDDMRSKDVEGGLDEPWYAHDEIARHLCVEEYSYE